MSDIILGNLDPALKQALRERAAGNRRLIERCKGGGPSWLRRLVKGMQTVR